MLTVSDTIGVRSCGSVFIALIVFSGCATTLSDRASRIRWVDQPEAVAGCDFVGIVDGSSTQSGVANISTGRNNARNEALERAAKKGATHIHWLSSDESFSGIHITAEAFRCSKRNRHARVAEDEREADDEQEHRSRSKHRRSKQNDETSRDGNSAVTQDDERDEGDGEANASATEARFATGTCFFVARSGLALTSLHVVEGAKRITVIDAAGTRARASVLARDERLDLAALQVDEDEPPGTLALDEDEVDLGDHVFTIGFPELLDLGADPKLTEGSVSGEKGLGLDFLLQTSAPVQPGNSGGPLINDAGHVVGIVALRQNYFSDGAAATNTAFAVKATKIKQAFRSLTMDSAKPARNRRAAIDRAREAVCLVVAKAD